MSTRGEPVGPAFVSKLRISPVKGLPQQEVDSLTLVPGGIAGDRRFAVVSADDRVLYSFYLPELAQAQARWDALSDVLELRFADGEVVRAGVELGEALTPTASGGARSVPGRVVLGPFAEALSARCGQDLRLLHIEVGAGGPGAITILGDGSVRRLAEQLGLERLDSRRFKMSIEIAGLEPHEEDTWEGCVAQIGTARLRVSGQVPRCALMTQDPDTRKRDHDVLRTILSYRAPMDTGEAPLGMYATVVEPGVVRTGDAVGPT
jgi:uncharacterized protein YcbX